jgi:hypothetical protein
MLLPLLLYAQNPWGKASRSREQNKSCMDMPTAQNVCSKMRMGNAMRFVLVRTLQMWGLFHDWAHFVWNIEWIIHTKKIHFYFKFDPNFVKLSVCTIECWPGKDSASSKFASPLTHATVSRQNVVSPIHTTKARMISAKGLPWVVLESPHAKYFHGKEVVFREPQLWHTAHVCQ